MASNFETHPKAWTDLGGGWARDERGYTIRTITNIADVVAEHCSSFDREGRPTQFTRLTTRRLLAAGGTFIANIDGHLADNHVVKFSDHSSAYRVKLAAARAQQVAA